MINPGDRPSRLALARHATGETSLDVSDVSAAQGWLDGLEAERARVEPFDFEVLRARAERLEEPARPARAPVAWWRRLLLLAPVLIAATAAVVLVAGPDVAEQLSPANRVKGEAELGFYLLRGDQVYPGDPDALLRAGDRLQFSYRTTYNRLVLLSIDGTGRLSVHDPESGDAGLPIVPGTHVLDGASILLDDAPGPEVFLGFFGEAWGVARAREVAERAYAEGGPDALVELAEADPSIATLRLEKE